MGQSLKAQELRTLLVLARTLRDYADATGDPHYADLFVQTAEALEGRAVYVANDPGTQGQGLNCVC
ncbi:MAG TPA: hypothetical protein VJ798_09020 [Rhizomicrobium sp.]|nr:hypothetical protein [Rhizomicrobium sp.]